MIDAYILIREDTIVDPKYIICLEKNDILFIAKEMTKYWLNEYELAIDDDEVDTELLGNQLYRVDIEDGTKIIVQPIKIRENNDN